MPEWVTIVAQAILNEWTIGTYSRFCDEVDFDSATVEEIAELIWREYQAAQQSVQSTPLRRPDLPAKINQNQKRLRPQRAANASHFFCWGY